MRGFTGRLVGLVALAAMPGCAEVQKARYVYQDGEFGVVGIPENTDRWPTHYRRQADKLIAAHFPEGHEIVRAEEVVEGSRRVVSQGTKGAELGARLPTDLFSVGTIGGSATRSQADWLKIKECRIIYRRAPGAPADPFAKRPDQSPARYVDPNAPALRDVPEPPRPDLEGGRPREGDARENGDRPGDAFAT